MKQRFTRIYVLMIGLLAAVALQAAPITKEQARQRAEQFLQAKPGNRQLTLVSNKAKLSPRRVKAKVAGTDLYYVFNRGLQQGYVIVSGDDQTLPVLGYTDEGEFDYNNIPDNMRSWLDDYEQQLQALSDNPPASEPRYAAAHDAIAPLVTSKWNQGYPYNESCPMYFTLGRSVTGCVATAMAQLLYYQRAKSVTETQADMPAYQGNANHATYGHLQVEGIPAGSPIDWDNMLDTYGSSATAKQRQAVADLMHYCGVSVNMDYTNNSSGAYSSAVSLALPKYFGYGKSVQYVGKYNYSEDAWDALIYNELAQGRPIYLSGANSSAGHAFVCDGYDGNRCFHINWGWGGASDGYFLLTSLNPSSQGIGGSGDGYSQGQEAIIGIEPENYGEKALPITNAMVKHVCLANFDANADGVFTFGEAATITDLGTAFSGQRIAEFDELYYFTSLRHIGNEAFSGCTSLKSIRLPKGLTTIGTRAFEKCTALKSLAFPDGVTTIGDSAFFGCKVFAKPLLPTGTKKIGAQAFGSCVAITEMTIPESVESLGDGAFAGCTKLTDFTVQTLRPQDLVLGTGVFEGIALADATLNVVQGTRDYYQSADQWKEFGTILQQRNLAQGLFVPITTNKDLYIYNVGTGRYLTKGEAWGTQAVVEDTDEPMRFQLRHTAAMPDGVYCLYSNDTGKEDGHYFFRTSGDNRVGAGVKACFVDRQNLTSDSYWTLTEVDDNVFVFSIPSTAADYVEGECLGVQTDHASNAASPTYGAYSDVSYADYTKNCQWMFVEYDAGRTALYQQSKVLENLLTLANKKHINTIIEQAVYDDFTSDIKAIVDAQTRLRKKMNLISFADKETYRLSAASFDVDGNSEISYAEAEAVTILGSNFHGTDIVTFDELKYFTSLANLYPSTFQDCAKLTSLTLPKSLTTIYYKTFSGCKSLASINLPEYLTYIDDNAFYGCSSLLEVTVLNPNPNSIQLGSNVFSGVPLSKATLYVPAGTRALYAGAPIWRTFGNIVELRASATPEPKPLVEGEHYYVQNVGTRLYLSKGEAWGTQSVVGTSPMDYEFRRSTSMPEGTYYLYSTDTGASGKNVIFRTTGDDKVGEGVKACFVDGTVSAKAYWTVAEVAENTYTMQVPVKDAEYVEGEYLGVDPDHASDVTYPTNGAYYDVSYSVTPANCQWQLISVADMEACRQLDADFEQLARLIKVAASQSIDTTVEQAVYDDAYSNSAQVTAAIASLREKLHYIDFTDERARTIILNSWDLDFDDEFTYDEASRVTDLSTMFRAITNVHGVDELRYFTSLTEIPDEAFYRCSGLVSAYLPAGVAKVGKNAFSGCTSLRYMAVLNPSQVVEASEAALPKGLTVFVPADRVADYQADAVWGSHTILPFTGIPTVVPDSASRQYGRSNSTFTYTVTGAPINGEPLLTSEADKESPVGEYPITAETGENTSHGFTYVPGVLTVERSPLTITAKSHTRNVGEENPEFTLSYRTFRNKETYEVLLTQPTVECDATIESPAGTYEIRVYGAEAQNYEISYVNGTLTVVDPTGVQDVSAAESSEPIYDLSGRRVETPRKGIYIRGNRRVLVK